MATAKSSVYSFKGNDVSPAVNAALNVIFGAFALICVLPVVLVFMVSITEGSTLFHEGFKFFPSKISWLAYDSLFKEWETIARGYGVSIFITVVGTAASVLIMGLYAYPVSRRDYPLRTFFMFFLFFTMLFNGGMVTKYIIYTQALGLRNHYMALILPLLMVPFNVIIMRTFFQTTIHPALIESAKIDGAGELRIFFRIIVPLSLPVLATIALFSTIRYWNDWFNALLFLSEEKMYPLQYIMMKTIKQVQYLKDDIYAAAQKSGALLNLPSESLQMAMAIIGMGPILIAYPFFQKYFVKGLTIGAIKG